MRQIDFINIVYIGPPDPQRIGLPLELAIIFVRIIDLEKDARNFLKPAGCAEL
ncbi:hypothetical protein [Roseinatronobacter sp.]|uniref:hypothetical protein n=1 Tax=Roseinatronobacter sp. TaxID=1945755 RepID=UPI003F70AE1C